MSVPNAATLVDEYERNLGRYADRIAAATAEADRLRAWLRFIAARTTGMGADLARQAINSDEPAPTKGPCHAKRR